MGDILHALPAVTALRIAHPSWVIDWVVQPQWRALLAADERGDAEPHGVVQPLVDRIYLAPTKEWGRNLLSPKTLAGIRALRIALRAGHYDTVLDLQGAVRSAVVGRLAGCRRLVGEIEPRERAARLLFSERVPTKGVHVIEQDLELASAVAGDALTYTRPLLPVDDAAEAWCDQLLSIAANNQANASAQPIALINPGAGWGAKRWPAERFGFVAKGLAERGFRVFVNAGPAEQSLTDVVVHIAAGAATPLACSLGQLIALTRRAALVIAGDTGPLHLACALGRPVVGIYGPTDPGRNGPYGSPFKVLRSAESRKDHSRRSKPEAGLLTIKPEDVLQAADALLREITDGATQAESAR
jgi:heptosyltransferase-1